MLRHQAEGKDRWQTQQQCCSAFGCLDQTGVSIPTLNLYIISREQGPFAQTALPNLDSGVMSSLQCQETDWVGAHAPWQEAAPCCPCHDCARPLRQCLIRIEGTNTPACMLPFLMPFADSCQVRRQCRAW